MLSRVTMTLSNCPLRFVQPPQYSTTITITKSHASRQPSSLSHNLSELDNLLEGLNSPQFMAGLG